MECAHNYYDGFSGLNCCIVIPTYNNASTLKHVIQQVLQFHQKIIVVNDGSTDNTLEILQGLSLIEVISYARNKGKGYALKCGFRKALDLGFEYAITIDSDGQHLPEDLPAFAKAIQESPHALIVGTRTLQATENVPAKNSFANRFSNFWYQLQTGIKLKDTQSGFRLYPLNFIKGRRFFSTKYEFELELLVRAAWNSVNIISIPINVYYAPEHERISHFRPFRDFLRISILNFFLTFLALVFFRPRLIIRSLKGKKLKEIIKEDLLSGNLSDKKIAVSLGFGIFMGILPIWGYQLVLGFIIAHFLKMSKTIFFLAANISIPPLIPFILYLSYVTGSFLMGNFSWKVDFNLSIEGIKANLLQYLAGSLVLAVVAALTLGLLTYFLLPFIRKKRQS